MRTLEPSYVTGTTSGRDVYVHALHAFLDRFLHREAPRGSGEHPKMERARCWFPPIRNYTVFFSSLFPSLFLFLSLRETSCRFARRYIYFLNLLEWNLTRKSEN